MLLYIFYTIIQRKILFFLLLFVYLTDVVTRCFTDEAFTNKMHDEFIKDVL